MSNAYKPRTLSGATRRIRQLEAQLEWHKTALSHALNDRHLLAKLSSDKPQLGPFNMKFAKAVRNCCLASWVWGITDQQRKVNP
jgi:hypothetical protein